MSLFEPLGRVEPMVSATEIIRIDLTGLPPGICTTDDFFFRLNQDGSVEWVVSRVCDHAGGKLLLKNDIGQAICPMHGWRLDLDTLRYCNVQMAKRRVPFEVCGGVLTTERSTRSLKLTKSGNPFGPVEVRLLSHACVLIDIAGVRIITDPWLIGPCFTTGWWPALPPRKDAVDLLRSADLIYVSHNHPDHCHLETLALIDRNMPIIVPNFASKSAQKILELGGHANVIPLQLGHAYRLAGTELSLTILKSGNFRDDSGLYLAAGDFEALLTVDCAHLNSGVLPENVDFLMTSFAGGASGYPLCFEIYSLETKTAICERQRLSHRTMLLDYVRVTKPRAYMPYAGFFTEAAARDRFIFDNNRKNSVEETLRAVRVVSPETLTINPLETEAVTISASSITPKAIELPRLYEVNDSYVNGYLERHRDLFSPLLTDEVIDYFAASGFRDDLSLFIVPSDDDFEPLGQAIRVDFFVERPRVQVLSAEEARRQYDAWQLEGGIRAKFLEVRAESLSQVISTRMPLEDLLIGFQCRVRRKPDVYNSNFWYHFSSVYVGPEHLRGSERCDGCARIVHGLHRYFEIT
jgi:CMP-N-acetylneuraminate monooxygenase